MVEARPWNVTVRSDVGSISAPAVRRPTCAAPIANGRSPKAFEILVLAFCPPALVCTMSLRVWFLNV